LVHRTSTLRPHAGGLPRKSHHLAAPATAMSGLRTLPEVARAGVFLRFFAGIFLTSCKIGLPSPVLKAEPLLDISRTSLKLSEIDRPGSVRGGLGRSACLERPRAVRLPRRACGEWSAPPSALRPRATCRPRFCPPAPGAMGFRWPALGLWSCRLVPCRRIARAVLSWKGSTPLPFDV
jgi:hypothetical protein